MIKARIVGWVSIWLILLGLSGFEQNSCQGTVEEQAVPASYLSGRLTPPQDLAHTVFDTPIHSPGLYAAMSEHLSKEDSKLKKHNKELLCGWRFDQLHQTPLLYLFSRHSAPSEGGVCSLAYLCRLNI